jgi:multimeric flavodoxin WrbA
MTDNPVPEMYMVMKILALHGSPRTIQSGTRKLAGFVLAGSQDAGAQTEMIDLTDYRITPCTACEGCRLTGICIYDDDVAGIIARMKEADAIHYQVLTGKYGCAIATTFESGGNDVVAYLNHVLNYLGVISVGGISIATQGNSGAIDAAEPDALTLGKILAGAILNGYPDPVQEKMLA